MRSKSLSPKLCSPSRGSMAPRELEAIVEVCVYEAKWCEGSSERGLVGKVRLCRVPKEKARGRIDSEFRACALSAGPSASNQ
jgi:hypothetical protein